MAVLWKVQSLSTGFVYLFGSMTEAFFTKVENSFGLFVPQTITQPPTVAGLQLFMSLLFYWLVPFKSVDKETGKKLGRGKKEEQMDNYFFRRYWSFLCMQQLQKEP